jgi:hypothetical protein
MGFLIISIKPMKLICKDRSSKSQVDFSPTYTQGHWLAVHGKYIPEVRAALTPDKQKEYYVAIASCAPGVSNGQTGSYQMSKQEALANAKLCAAAPEMFELLLAIRLGEIQGGALNNQIDHIIKRIS